MTEATADKSSTSDLAMLQENLRKNPQDLGSHTRLGWALFSLEKFDEAATTFQSAYDRWPSEVEVNYGLGLALKMQGHRERAAESFLRVDSLDAKTVRDSMMKTLAAEQKEYLLQKV